MNYGTVDLTLKPESFWGNSLRKRSICKILEVIKLFKSSLVSECILAGFLAETFKIKNYNFIYSTFDL